MEIEGGTLTVFGGKGDISDHVRSHTTQRKNSAELYQNERFHAGTPAQCGIGEPSERRCCKSTATYCDRISEFVFNQITLSYLITKPTH